MNFLTLHDHDGNEVKVNLERIVVIEPYKYGFAKLTRLYFSDSYSYSVLETPDEIFESDRGKAVEKSVLFARACIYKRELKEIARRNASWYPYKDGGEQCDT